MVYLATVGKMSDTDGQGKGPYRRAPRERPHFINEWRINRGLTQQALGELTGMTANAISLIESGKRDPSLSTLRKIADVLDVRPGWLLDRDPTDPANTWSTAETLQRLEEAQRKLIARMIETLTRSKE